MPIPMQDVHIQEVRRHVHVIPGDPRECDEPVFWITSKVVKIETKSLHGKEAKCY